MEVEAKMRFLRVSPTKAAPVVDQIRGMEVENALQTLQFSRIRIAHNIRKILLSAIANAENNEGLDVDTLYVSRATVDQGPTIKRIRPRARGRASRILKRTSHVTVAVRPRES
jgi:large subunit ribosomal protein L22